MPTRIMKRAVFGAAAMLMAGLAQATLQDRDLDHNGVTDTYYDTDLNITWLRDVNVAQQTWYQWVASAASFQGRCTVRDVRKGWRRDGRCPGT